MVYIVNYLLSKISAVKRKENTMGKYHPNPKNNNNRNPEEIYDEDIRIEVWGPFACFTRPDLKTERVSYEVMTPSAARNILQAIYWHPGVNYEITAIEVIKPVQFLQMKRNELKSKISPTNVLSAARQNKAMYLNSDKDIMQRSSLILKDLHYVIHTNIIIQPEYYKTKNELTPDGLYRKAKNIIIRRARRGECFTQPYLGIKEYPCNFRFIERYEKTYPTPLTKDLGVMLYDLNYKDPQKIIPVFFHATIQNGIMNLKDIKLFTEISKEDLIIAPPPDHQLTRNERSYK